MAEADLKRGDCRAASEAYAQAAAIGDAKLARRATQVAMACEHLPAAWQAATRWRTLAPGDREADALYAAVALKLYRTQEARAAIRDFWRAEEQQAAPAPAAPGAPVAGARSAARAAKSMTELTALLLEESDAPAVLTAMSGALEPTANSPETLTLLGELALAAYDGQRAAGLCAAGPAAESEGPGGAAGAGTRLRDAGRCAAGGRHGAPGHGRRRHARRLRAGREFWPRSIAAKRLTRSSSGCAPTAHRTGEVDRRLALLAFKSGDLKEARQRFTELLSSGEGNDAAQLYLADIAARDGDADAAIAEYRRLYDSSVALSARSRAAALLLDKRARTEALALLDDYAADHPEEELDLTLAKARLLADHGEADTGLALLSAALERHPQHPSIEYDRAVILEQAGHVHESVEALEHMLTERPDDPTLLNALGYTLADHTLELPHAEALIRRALVVMPDNPAALDSLGWVRFREGDARGAAGVARARLRARPRCRDRGSLGRGTVGERSAQRRAQGMGRGTGARSGFETAQGDDQPPPARCALISCGRPRRRPSLHSPWSRPAAPCRRDRRRRCPGKRVVRSCRRSDTSSCAAAWRWPRPVRASTPACAGFNRVRTRS